MTNPISTVFIHETAIRLRDTFPPGHILTASDAAVLNTIFLNRFVSRMGWKLKREDGAVSAAQIAAWAGEVAESVALMDSTGEMDDPIREEALQLARDMILEKLAEDNLPSPPGIEVHAEELLEGMPQLLDQAKRRMEIRREVAAQALNALEIAL